MDNEQTQRLSGPVKPIASRTILVAEDSRLDEELFSDALQRVGIANHVQTVHSGDEAIEYLSHAGKYANREDFPTPHIIVLDPKMRPKSGWDILEWVREHPVFRAVVVIMFGGSGSEAEADIAHRFGANAHLMKPSALGEFDNAVESICRFWLLTVDH